MLINSPGGKSDYMLIWGMIRLLVEKGEQFARREDGVNDYSGKTE
jgi:hypothetical protein